MSRHKVDNHAHLELAVAQSVVPALVRIRLEQPARGGAQVVHGIPMASAHGVHRAGGIRARVRHRRAGHGAIVVATKTRGSPTSVADACAC